MRRFFCLFISSFIFIFTLSFIFPSVSGTIERQNNSISSTTKIIRESPVNTIAEIERTQQITNINNNSERENSDIPDTAEGQKFRQIVEYAKVNNLSQLSLGETISTIGKQFIGAKYRAGLLDKTGKETLFISLQDFDCVLFVETILALAQNIHQQNYSYQNFTNNVVDRRYRDGKLTDYCSRLHYFSDWIADNQKRGNVINITADLGGIILPKQLNFMSDNWQKYPEAIRNQTNYDCIVQTERNLAEMAINYIPQKEIDKIYPQLRSGDIIAVATNIKGLDVTHTGFATVDSQGKVSFLHASPAGRVTIAPDLKTYIGRVNNAVGIIVARAI